MAKPDWWVELKFDRQWRTMVKIENKLMSQMTEATDATIDAIIADIRSSWSGVSPSNRGEAPALVTGNLDSSVQADEQGRDELGRFAGKDAVVRFIRVDTSQGDDPGDRGNYAMALEDPDYLNRPFIAPALERGFDIYNSNIKRFVRL